MRDQEGNLILWVPTDKIHGVNDMSLLTLPPDAPNCTIWLDYSDAFLGEEWSHVQVPNMS